MTVICEPPSETVFPVGTTTVNCSATDVAGNTTSASFHVTVIAPFEVGLSFDPTSSVNPVAGLVTIRGSVSCNRDAGTWISGTLSQVISNRAVVSGFFGTTVECVAPGPTLWSATVSVQPSRFKAGKASVQANAGGCNVTCDAEANSAAITLRAR